MKWFLNAKTEGAIIARTFVEAILGWLGANLGDIFGLFKISNELKTLIMGLLMVIITAILSCIRKAQEKNKEQ